MESNGELDGDVCVEGVVVGGDEEAPGDCVAMLGSVLVIEDRAANDSDSGNIVLRSVVDEKGEAAKVGSSVLGEEILEELSDGDVGVGGEAVVGVEIPGGVGVGAANEFEGVGDFMRLIVERSVAVSSWRTFKILKKVKESKIIGTLGLARSDT